MNVHQNWFALQDSTDLFAFLIQLDFSYTMTVVGCLDQSNLLLISMRACIGACRNPKTSSVQDICYS
jgi:hypothetical protein